MTYRLAIGHALQSRQTAVSISCAVLSEVAAWATEGDIPAAIDMTFDGCRARRMAPMPCRSHHFAPFWFRRASNANRRINNSGETAGSELNALKRFLPRSYDNCAPVALQRASKTFATSRKQPQAEFSAHNQYLPNSCIFNAPLTVMRGTGLSVFSQSAQP